MNWNSIRNSTEEAWPRDLCISYPKPLEPYLWAFWADSSFISSCTHRNARKTPATHTRQSCQANAANRTMYRELELKGKPKHKPQLQPGSGIKPTQTGCWKQSRKLITFGSPLQTTTLPKPYWSADPQAQLTAGFCCLWTQLVVTTQQHSKFRKWRQRKCVDVGPATDHLWNCVPQLICNSISLSPLLAPHSPSLCILSLPWVLSSRSS